MNKTLEKLKEIKEDVQHLHFDDIKLINRRVEIELLIMKFIEEVKDEI